jgi:chromosome segregation ATPase
MKARAQKRKEKDEHCIAELRVAMNNMDRSLAQEIKRRVEGNKALEMKAREEIAAMEKRLMLVLDDRVQSFRHNLNLLEEKVRELNERLEEEKRNIPHDIEQKGKELKEMLQEVQNEFSVERRDRLAREGKLMKQLNDHHQHISERWRQETEERTRDAEELKSRLEHHENNRANADEEFESLITSELKALKDALEQETMERKVEDDEIVEALNRYTANLQKSLSMLD